MLTFYSYELMTDVFFIVCQRHILRSYENHFFGNNSGKREPTETKLYMETTARMARSPENLWRRPPNGRKMAMTRIV